MFPRRLYIQNNHSLSVEVIDVNIMYMYLFVKEQIEFRQQTLCGRGLQTPPALTVSLLQGDVDTGRGEGKAGLIRLD